MNDGTFSAGYVKRTIIKPIAVWKPIGEVIEEPELPVPTPPINTELLERAREAWITYFTPIWREAGKSEEWISQNIINEWTTNQGDILQSYLTEVFTPPPLPPTPAPVVGIKLGSYIPWIFATLSLGGFLIAVGTKGGSK